MFKPVFEGVKHDHHDIQDRKKELQKSSKLARDLLDLANTEFDKAIQNLRRTQK